MEFVFHISGYDDPTLDAEAADFPPYLQKKMGT